MKQVRMLATWPTSVPTVVADTGNTMVLDDGNGVTSTCEAQLITNKSVSQDLQLH